MWGTQKPQGTYPSKRRFISTYCGKNDYFRAVATVLRSPSPRVWGPLAALRTVLKSPGSSPRMRGTPNSNLRSVRMPGLIPTYAGNTFPAALQVPHQRVHPHVCGEHTYRPLRIAMLWGSSPRMRGTHGEQHRWLQRLGLIPTYAGNTAQCRR